MTVGVAVAAEEAAKVKVSSSGISPVGTRVGVSSTATTVAPAGASMVGLVSTWAEGSSVQMGEGIRRGASLCGGDGVPSRS